MVAESGITKLNLIILVTTVLVFGTVAAILGIVLLASGMAENYGVFAWLGISLIMLFIQWYFGPALIKWITKAKEVKESEAPEMHQMLSNLAKTAGIPKPKLYAVQDNSPNAFAFGRTQGSSGIAVHSGLLQMLNKQEVEAVLAHEVGHIKHRDVAVMTIAAVVPIILYYAVLMFASRGDRDRGAGSFIAVWFGAIAAQLFGQVLVMWLSRQREYYADAFSAYATRKPTNLMSALAKITYKLTPTQNARHETQNGIGSSVMKSLYIAEPSLAERQMAAEVAGALQAGDEKAVMEAIRKEKSRGAMELLMTHPLTAKRMEALMKLKKEIATSA